MGEDDGAFPLIRLGRLGYRAAFERQQREHARVLAAREAGSPMPGVILAVEHPPVVTISNRAGAAAHLIAPAERLAALGVAVERTDRGGDITYHGPGQVVLYPILDLNLLNLGLHDYMRVLEESVIRACAAWGVRAEREPGATGVWVRAGADGPGEKVCAFGVRVRKWVSMHGLALNVRTDLSHFDLIVPCGLHGRRATSLHALLGERAPTWDEACGEVTARLRSLLLGRLASAREKRAAAGA
ncbi:MAG TPA: lipoyl(octanoyl) transferase LipB [Phycisphaerales bacterium]|nr:lipoyl(octanoyl) transferase LipB [Phycisphaerales bacterium]